MTRLAEIRQAACQVIAGRRDFKAASLALAAVLLAAPALAQDERGNQGTVDGFFAATVMTSDADWREKWTSGRPEETVHLTEVRELHVGEKTSILTFFANPEVKDGAIDIRCDLKLTRPDGSEVTQPEGQCAGGAVEGDLKNLRLTGMVIEMVGEEGDARGIWTAEIGVTDANRGVRVPLTLSYELKDAE